MCIVQPKKLKIKKNITVYKVLNYEETQTDCILYDFFDSDQYFFNEIKMVENNEPKIDKGGNIYRGFLQTFKRKKDAIRLKQSYSNTEQTLFGNVVPGIIVKCTIPKDSEFVYKGYYYGWFEGKKPKKVKTYGSQKLRLDKIVWNNSGIIDYKTLFKKMNKAYENELNKRLKDAINNNGQLENQLL